jgi:hypothetical protein
VSLYPCTFRILTDPCPFLEFLLDTLSSCSECTPSHSLYGFGDLE